MEFFAEIHRYLMDAERIPYAIVAVLLAAAVGLMTGPVGGKAVPLIWQVVSVTFGKLGDRLDRKQRTRSDLMFRGFVMMAICLFAVLLLSGMLELASSWRTFYGIFELAGLLTAMAAGTIWRSQYLLFVALEKKTIGQGAYYAIAHAARRNLSISDDYGIARTGIALGPRMFDKGLVSPVFWYLLGGLPLALVYGALAALVWRFGKDGFGKGFGAVPLALEKIMGFVPSAFTALLLTAASVFTPDASIGRAVKAWLGNAGRAPYEQGGLPLSVTAWALGVSLGGAAQDLNGSAIQAAWVGPDGATAKVDHGHMKRAIYLGLMAHLLFVLALGGAYLWSGAPL